MKICEIDGCLRKVLATGLCRMHYNRRSKGQDMHAAPKRLTGLSIRERLDAIGVRSANGCLECTLVPSTNGHCQIKIKGKHKEVHVLAWELENGPVPDGQVINHMCGNRICFDASHLDSVTQTTNAQYRTVLAKNNTTGYRNVHLDKRTGKYHVIIRAEGESFYFSGFKSAEDANIFAIDKRRELHGIPEFSDWRDQHLKSASS